MTKKKKKKKKKKMMMMMIRKGQRLRVFKDKTEI
jgi:hypothetical protein